MLDLGSMIAVAYLIYSRQAITDVVLKNNFNIIKYFRTILACGKCFAFWSVWCITQDLKSALLISFMVYLMQSFIVTKL